MTKSTTTKTIMIGGSAETMMLSWSFELSKWQQRQVWIDWRAVSLSLLFCFLVWIQSMSLGRWSFVVLIETDGWSVILVVKSLWSPSKSWTRLKIPAKAPMIRIIISIDLWNHRMDRMVLQEGCWWWLLQHVVAGSRACVLSTSSSVSWSIRKELSCYRSVWDVTSKCDLSFCLLIRPRMPSHACRV